MAARDGDGQHPCSCGHQPQAHEHYRRGTDCALCECGRFTLGVTGLRSRVRALLVRPSEQSGPQTTRPETTLPETTAPEPTRPETASPESASPADLVRS